ncbi:MAG: hypothetical protein GVY19_00695 [Bacteroidetes bacterium]|jgi:hypothetical protein|nr:hypothetical protein [Bacteroidota bacterium]
MIFIGIFSGPLPYIAVFAIYLLGMINYSFQAKEKDQETYAENKTIEIDKEQIQSIDNARERAKTIFYHTFLSEKDWNGIIQQNLFNASPPCIISKVKADVDASPKIAERNTIFFIRPPPHAV